MATGNVKITSSADVSAISRATRKIQQDFKKTGEEVKRTRKSVDSLVSGFQALAGAAALERVVSGLGSLVDSTLRSRAEIKSLADQSNISAQLMGTLADAAGRVNVSTDQLAGSLKALTAKAYEAATGSKGAADEFASLGIAVDDLSGPDGKMRSTEEILRLVLEQLGRMPGETERAAAAQKLMGEGAGGLTAALGTLSEQGLQRAEERAKAFTRHLDGPGLEAAEKYRGEMVKLSVVQAAAGDALSNIAVSVLPAFTEGIVYMATLLSEIASGTFQDFVASIEMAGTGLAGLAEAFLRYSVADFQGAKDTLTETGEAISAIKDAAGLSLNPLQALSDNLANANEKAQQMVQNLRGTTGETDNMRNGVLTASDAMRDQLGVIDRVIEKTQEKTDKQREYNASVREGQQVLGDYVSTGLVPYTAALSLAAPYIEERIEAQARLQEALQALAADEAAAAAAADKREAKQAEMRQGAIGLFSQTASVVGDLAGMLLTAATASEEMTEKQVKAARRAFVVQKAAALAQAIISTALGVARSLDPAVGGPPPINFITAGLVGAAGAVQVATIATQKPSFALGGVMPTSGAPALLHPGEGVLSQGAVDAMGGRGGLAAQNARSGSTGGAVVVQWKHIRQSFNAEVTDAGRGTGPLREIRRDGRRAGQRRHAMRPNYGAL